MVEAVNGPDHRVNAGSGEVAGQQQGPVGGQHIHHAALTPVFARATDNQDAVQRRSDAGFKWRRFRLSSLPALPDHRLAQSRFQIVAMMADLPVLHRHEA